jgi:FK506-binding protein 1
MAVEKKVLKPGNGVDRPKKGDTVTMEYTGWLQDLSQAANDNKGKQYVSC